MTERFEIHIEQGRTLGYGLIAIGAGITAWSAFSYYQKKKLIDDYITEAKIYREFLIEAYEDGVVTEDERRFLDYMQSELTRKEKLIEQAGIGEKLVEALRLTFGITITYASYKITSRLLEAFWRKYRPPGKKWECPIDGKEFSSEDELRRHLEEEHGITPDVSAFVALWEALQNAPEWFRNVVADVAGIAVETINRPREWYEGLPEEQKIALGVAVAIACIIILALIWWAAGIPTLATVLSRATAIFV